LLVGDPENQQSEITFNINYLKRLQAVGRDRTRSAMAHLIKLTDPHFIMVAQIVVDQIVLSSLGTCYIMFLGVRDCEITIADEYPPHSLAGAVDQSHEKDHINTTVSELQRATISSIGLDSITGFLKYSSLADPPNDQSQIQKNLPRQNTSKPSTPGPKPDPGQAGKRSKLVRVSLLME
jgi:hypothetical protein